MRYYYKNIEIQITAMCKLTDTFWHGTIPSLDIRAIAIEASSITWSSSLLCSVSTSYWTWRPLWPSTPTNIMINRFCKTDNNNDISNVSKGKQNYRKKKDGEGANQELISDNKQSYFHWYERWKQRGFFFS